MQQQQQNGVRGRIQIQIQMYISHPIPLVLTLMFISSPSYFHTNQPHPPTSQGRITYHRSSSISPLNVPFLSFFVPFMSLISQITPFLYGSFWPVCCFVGKMPINISVLAAGDSLIRTYQFLQAEISVRYLVMSPHVHMPQAPWAIISESHQEIGRAHV